MGDAEDYDYEEVSDEEKIKIAQHFVVSSPPFQIGEVTSDVKKLLPDGLLTDGALSGAYRVYNLENCVSSDLNGEKVLICKSAEVDPTHYVDPKSKQVFGFNHISQEVVASDVQPSASDMDEATAEYSSAVQKALDDYCAGQYPDGRGQGSVYFKGGKLEIVICSSRDNLRNYYSGNWRSTFTVSLSQNSAEISGVIKLHAHYFEDGNVQLSTKKDIEASTLKNEGADSLASEVINAIKAQEDKIQSGLEDMYANMKDETFRALRRVMTVRREKFNWSVAETRLVGKLRQ